MWQMQQAYAQRLAMQPMLAMKGKGKGQPNAAEYPQQPTPDGPRSVPDSLPQDAAGGTPSGITLEWAQRRAVGKLPPESDIVAGLLNSMNPTPAKDYGKGGYPTGRPKR